MAPTWAKAAAAEEPGKEGTVKAKSSWRPDTLTFLAALDNFSLAAHACGVSSCQDCAYLCYSTVFITCRFGITVQLAPTLAS